MADDAIERAIARAGSSIEEQLTQRLRAAAKESNWPSEIVENLSVTSQDGTFHVVTNPEVLERALDHEFGTQEILARPVIRRFCAHQIDGFIAREYADRVLQSLEEAGHL